MEDGKPRPLEAAFFARPALVVARELLGCELVRERAGKMERVVIRETEAYIGPEDLACHASKGRTRRTEVMYGPAGHWYVYLCYGIHWLLNVVTGPEGHPEAVLLRAAGESHGPGVLTKALRVDGEFYGKTCSPRSGLWILAGAPVPEAEVVSGPRVGVDYAGEWALKPFRFRWIRGDEKG